MTRSGAANNSTTPHVVWLDALRIAATLAVIVLHVSSQGWHTAQVGMKDWLIFNAVNGCVRWGVPVFVMISGSLFLDPERPLDVRRLYRKNLLHIVCAFCFWSAVYMLYAKWQDPSLRPLYLLNKFLQGQYHMWFLFLIAGLYVAAPLLRKIAEDKKTAEYFLIAAFVAVFVFNTLGDLADFCLPHIADERLSLIVAALRADWAKTYFFLPLGYSAYFVAGSYLRRWPLSASVTRLVYVLSLAAFVVTPIVSAKMSAVNGAATEFHNNLALNILFEALGVFLLFQNVAAHCKPASDGTARLLNRLSQYSFGVYLVHVLCLELLKDEFVFKAVSLPAGLSVPLLTLCVAAASLVISAVLNHIPGLKGRIV